MSDAPPPVRPEQALGRHPAGPLTPGRVDAVLADFRGWLEQLGDDNGAVPKPPAEAVDLFTLVGQFTALRHEVNLQTKAARAATDQTAEALKLCAAPRPAADPDDAVRPLVKTLIDIADALMTSLRHVEKARAAAEEALAGPPPTVQPKPGLLARLFGTTLPPEMPSDAGLAGKLRPLVAGVADGYALSLRRVERALAAAGAEAIECVGRPFDPELMEVVEAVDADGRPAGTVVDEVRRGYRWKGSVFRFALVKVAR